jgi:hypothetical protein
MPQPALQLSAYAAISFQSFQLFQPFKPSEKSGFRIDRAVVQARSR